jgi:tetratricopeptide (TPR) repeat protein
MNKQVIALAAAVGLVAVSPGWAIDKVITTAKDKAVAIGRVVSITPQQVEIEPQASLGVAKQIPVNEIRSIQFEDEPGPLSMARRLCGEGDYAEALDRLEKYVPAGTDRREIATEIDFFKAYCAAQMALSGNANIVEAGGRMLAFVKTHETSYHYYQACELIGDLLAAKGDYARAEPYYRKLAAAPWHDYKMRAGIAMGRNLLAQGKVPEASKQFDDVIAGEGIGELAEAQRMAAKVGKARCLTARDKLDDAVKTLQKIIAEADADNADLNALAYNALGTALRKAHKPQEAVLAFLHVELLYSSNPDAHAEALANLCQLFDELGNKPHARHVRAILEERYKNSHWATGLK